MVTLVVLALVVGATASGLVIQNLNDDNDYVGVDDNSPPSAQDSQGNEILFTNLYRSDGASNSYSQNSESATTLQINSEQELSDLWVQLFKGVLPPPKPSIDYKVQSVLVVMPAQKTTDGYLATIQKIRNDNGVLELTLTDKSPGNACTTRKVPTRPIHVIAIGKVDIKSINVSTLNTYAAPCAVPL